MAMHDLEWSASEKKIVQARVSRVASAFGLLHPGRDVPLGVEHAPDVYVVVAFNVEDQVWVALEFTTAQSWKGELEAIVRGPGGGMANDSSVSGLQGVNETQRYLGPGLADVVVNGGLDVPTSQLAEDKGLLAHPAFARRTRSLRLRK